MTSCPQAKFGASAAIARSIRMRNLGFIVHLSGAAGAAVGVADFDYEGTLHDGDCVRVRAVAVGIDLIYVAAQARVLAHESDVEDGRRKILVLRLRPGLGCIGKRLAELRELHAGVP